MNIFRYLKDSRLQILGFISLCLLLNLFLLASSSLQQSCSDILYLDILLLSVALTFFTWSYRAWKDKYGDLHKALEEKTSPDFCLPGGDSLEAQLFKDLLVSKNKHATAQLAELQCSLAELNDFITRWVHEIKIPISVCELIIDRIDENCGRELAARLSEEMHMEMERMNFLVNQILYAGRATSYAEDLLVEECSLSVIVKDAVKRNSSFFISQGIALQLGNTDLLVMTDRKWLSYILDQLLNNACKYVDQGGKIEIFATEDDIAVYLVIRDNGTGIAPKDIHRVFERGFTGDNGRKVVKSTGMGLYFSKKMAAKMGHKLEVTSQPGEYTEFTITIYKMGDYFKVTEM